MTRRALYKPKSMDLVLVEWDDAHYDGEFDGKPDAVDSVLARLHNVGYFVKMTKASVVLVSCFQPSNGTVRWLVTIPRANVIAIRPLSEVFSGPKTAAEEKPDST